MILRGRSVVTMDGAPLANGAVAISGPRIVDVGPWSEVRARHAGEVLDLGEVVLLPGLINAHCHLEYTDLRERLPRPSSFTSWIRAINEAKAEWSEADYVRSILRGADEAAKFGTMTMANLEAFPKLIAQLPELPLRVLWLAEMIDVRSGIDPEVLRQMEGVAGLAPHAPYTASPDLYRAAGARGTLASTHLAESRDEMQMFRDGAGELFELLRGMGRKMDDCGRLTPLALLLERGLLDERWIVAHLNELTAGDLELLTHAPRFHVVHCPRSHAYFAHAPFRFAELRALGFRVSLGTDSLASNNDLSLFAEMREFQRKFPTVAPAEILAMTTTEPASALGMAEKMGRIAPGCVADLIALPCNEDAEDSIESVLEFCGEVPWRMRNGTLDRPR